MPGRLLIIGGLSEDPADAPGPFGNYLPATTHSVQRTTSSSGAGPTNAKLFDGTEKALSWDNILWLNRSVLVP